MKFRNTAGWVLVGGGAASVCTLYYQYNETEVKKRTARLDRIGETSEKILSYPRIHPCDNDIIKELKHPLLITGLLSSWPASRKWTFEYLRSVLLF